MQRLIPNYSGRSPEEIVTKNVNFDTVGYVYRALSWLDISKKSGNVAALQYAAHDTRQAIEHLLFEAIVLSVGTVLDQQEYQRCKGNSTKLHKIVTRLNPDYEKLVQFTRAVLSTELEAPPIIAWDHKQLMKYWGIVSGYLHWGGEPKETVESKDWLEAGIAAVEDAAGYIWENKIRAYSGIMMPENMQPEIRSLWGRFKSDEMDLEAVKRAADIALAVLRSRNETLTGFR